jgi:hypothetical protein
MSSPRLCLLPDGPVGGCILCTMHPCRTSQPMLQKPSLYSTYRRRYITTRDFKPAKAFHIVCSNSNHHDDVHSQLTTNHLSCFEGHIPLKYFIPYRANNVFSKSKSWNKICDKFYLLKFQSNTAPKCIRFWWWWSSLGSLELDQFTIPTRLMNGVELELEPTANKIWIQQDLEAVGLHANAGCLWRCHCWVV